MFNFSYVWKIPFTNLQIEITEVSLIVGAFVALVLIAAILYAINASIQMKVSLLMDSESRVYNRLGLERLLKKKKKYLKNGSFVEVRLNNLDRIYDYYDDKAMLMFILSNSLMNGLKRKEFIARTDFDRFVIVFYNRKSQEIEEYIKEVMQKLNDNEVEDYGIYHFEQEYGVYTNDDYKADNWKKVAKRKRYLAVLNHLTSIIDYTNLRENNIYYYSESVNLTEEKVEMIKNGGEHALNERKFEPYFTPQVCFRTGRVIGALLTVEWMTDNKTIAFQNEEYVKVLENSAFMQQLDLDTFELACQTITKLNSNLPSDFVLIVPLSPYSFQSSRFLSNFKGIISRYTINFNQISIGITPDKKYLKKDDYEKIINTINSFGLKCTQLNYGAEKNSLLSMMNTQVYSYRFSPLFMAKSLDNEKDRTIVDGSISIVKNYNSKTIVTGIGNEETIKELARISRDLILEGSFFANKLSMDEFEVFLAKIFQFDYLNNLEMEKIQLGTNGTKDSTNTKESEKVHIEKETVKIIQDDNNRQLDELRRQMEEMRRSFEEKLYNEREKVHKMEIESLRKQLEENKNNNNNNNAYPNFYNPYGYDYQYLNRELYDLRKQFLDLKDSRYSGYLDSIDKIRMQLAEEKNARVDSNTVNDIALLKQEIERIKLNNEKSEDDERYMKLQRQIEEMKNNNNSASDEDERYMELQRQIEEMKNNNNSASDEDERYLALQRQIEELKSSNSNTTGNSEELLLELKKEIASIRNNVPQNEIDVDSIIEKLKKSQTEQFNSYMEETRKQQQELLQTLEQERREREELERMISELNGEEEEVDVSEEEIAKDQEEANKNVNLDIENLDSDDNDNDDSDDEDDEDQPLLDKPTLTLEEVEAIIKTYKDKYFDEWNKMAKLELKDGYYEVINGLKYYRGRLKKNLPERIKDASPEVKKLYNIVKNELMQYNDTRYKVTNHFDSIYVNKTLVAKLSITKRRVRVYMAIDPNEYSNTQFPHRDVSHKKVHIKTPYLMFIKSQLSVRRLRVLIADLMTVNGTRFNQEYTPVDYANMFKFYKRNK